MTTPEKIKIALCMSGHMRMYQKYLETLRPLAEEFELCLFLKTWDHMDFNYNPGDRCYHSPLQAGLDSKSPIDIEKIRQDYEAIGVTVIDIQTEPYISNEYWYSRFEKWCYGQEAVKNRLCQWMLIRDACQMKMDYEKKHEMMFDYCIYTRPDVIYYPEHICKYLFTDKIVLGDKQDPFHLNADHFWMGPSESMDKVCCLFNDFEEIYQVTANNEKFPLHCHRLLWWWCTYRNIPFINEKEHCAEIVKPDKFIF